MTEPIVVVLQTYKRTSYALRTVAAALKYLRYGDVRWYIADDGSDATHVDTIAEALFLADVQLAGIHSQRRGYGGNANAAWTAADQIGALTFWLEDDWELREPLDLYPYACLLMEREEVAMVRLGALNLDVRGRTWGHASTLYWKLDREPHHEGTPVFTGHPSLRHRRYHDAYGWYPEGLAPGDTELAYAYQFRQGVPEAPGIVWPADYPSGGHFGHIGEIKTEHL